MISSDTYFLFSCFVSLSEVPLIPSLLSLIVPLSRQIVARSRILFKCAANI